ncbi:MAG: UDP-N-acetylglucosamine 2-epimerase (non-hydrolyzing) [Bacteroidia bacterium]
MNIHSSALKRILVVVGTRPNFIKITQFRKAASAYSDIDLKIVHTGQHFDARMADVFFKQFQLQPDFFLNVQSGSPVQQMADIMKGLEQVMTDYKPDLVMVVGDVNSTLAAAITANKMNVKLAHVESGLRSFDRSMPEEHNRVLTDHLADLFFVTEQDGMDNLQQEGKDMKALHFVGNTMIDTMVSYEKEIDASDILNQLQLRAKAFVLMTMHRPANVDSKEGLEKLMELINYITASETIVFPVHPRTIKVMTETGLITQFKSNTRLMMIEPLDYFAFQKLIKESAFVITDSGGIQEETTFLRVPCLTLRPNTERPVTVKVGTNTLLPFQLTLIERYIDSIRKGTYKKGEIPALWDGRATERIFKVLSEYHWKPSSI